MTTWKMYIYLSKEDFMRADFIEQQQKYRSQWRPTSRLIWRTK